MAYSATELAEGYGFIAAFVAGTTLRSIERDHTLSSEAAQFQRSCSSFSVVKLAVRETRLSRLLADEPAPAGAAPTRRASIWLCDRPTDPATSAVALATYTDDADVGAKLFVWDHFYNLSRPHGAFNGKAPYEGLRERL